MSCPKLMHPDPAHLAPRAKSRSRQTSPVMSRQGSLNSAHASQDPLQNLESLSQGEIFAEAVAAAVRREFSIMHDLMNTMMARTADQKTWFESEFHQMKSLQLRVLDGHGALEKKAGTGMAPFADSTSSAVDGPEKDKSKAFDDKCLVEIVRVQNSIAGQERKLERLLDMSTRFWQEAPQYSAPGDLSKNQPLQQARGDESLLDYADISGAAVGQNMVQSPDEEPLNAAAKKANDRLVEENVGSAGRDEMFFWNELQQAAKNNTAVVYDRIMTLERRSIWHAALEKFDALHLIRQEMPPTCFANLTKHPIFVGCQAALILINTAIMGWETDLAIKAALQDPPGTVPGWLGTCNSIFNTLFAVELLFRIFALRTWFFVAPRDWTWNAFDVFVVVSSILTDVLGGVNLSFVRTFRIMRAVRAVRLIRVLRFFTELRKILFAILACLASLAWCFLFLLMTMFLFAILLLQGIVDAVNAMEPGSLEHIRACGLAREWYGSVGDSMASLLGAVTTGDDFFTFGRPLTTAGYIYLGAYVLYILFVTVGVMNVLTGVFLSSADQFADRALVIQNQEVEQERFVKAMTEIFEEKDMDASGSLTWPEFAKAISCPMVAAYLASFDLNVTHARLVFDLLDEDRLGELKVHEFVMGLLTLKGAAKGVDSRILQREVGMLPKLFNLELKNALCKK